MTWEVCINFSHGACKVLFSVVKGKTSIMQSMPCLAGNIKVVLTKNKHLSYTFKFENLK